MVVLGWILMLIWCCSLLAVAALFYRVERDDRKGATEWRQADHPALPAEQGEGLDEDRPLAEKVPLRHDATGET